VCTATKQTPYQLVFGQAPRSNLALVDLLFSLGIHDEEELPDSIIVDAGSDQSIEDNGERAIYISENITAEVEQSTGDYGGRDVSIKQ
jgi:hypothetical protein